MVNSVGDMMKQAQQIQARLAKIQEEASKKTVEASSGGNMVTATVSGRLEIISLKIDDSVAAANDLEMLQDLVVAAVNEGIRRAQKMMASEMSQLTGGMNIPGLNTSDLAIS